MSKFYGSLEGSAKTVATRRGHRFLEGHIRGWNIGVKVVCSVDSDGKDVITVYRTNGSNDSCKYEKLVEIREA